MIISRYPSRWVLGLLGTLIAAGLHQLFIRWAEAQPQGFTPSSPLLAAHASTNQEGCPRSGPPVNVRFNVPNSGQVSVNVMQDDPAPAALVRRLVIGEQMEAGPHTVAWDGLDETCKPVPSGRYRLAGLVSNLGVRYLSTLGNTSPQPYGGLRNYGDFRNSPGSGGEYREGNHWHDVIMNVDGSFYLMNSGGEHGPTIQLIDPAHNYKVAWGRDIMIEEQYPDNTKTQTEFEQVGARDEQYLYFVVGPFRQDPASPKSVYAHQSLIRVDPRTPPQDPRSIPVFSSTRQKSLPLTGEVAGGGWHFGEEFDIRGLGAFDGKVFVPFFNENRIDVYDGDRGIKMASITDPHLNGPSDVWVSRARTLLVVDQHSVHRFSLKGVYLGTPVTGLLQGWAVTEGPSGEIIVSDRAANQVKYFTAQGKFLRALGPPGGASVQGRGPLYLPAYPSFLPWLKWSDWVGGPFYEDHLFHPEGIAADRNGNIVVMEPEIGLAQVFDPNGRPKKSLIAQVYSTFFFDPARPNPVYVEGENGQILREYQLDWNTGEHKLLRQWFPDPSGPIGTQYVKWKGDLPYFFDDDKAIYTIENNKIRVCMMLGRPNESFSYVQEDGSVVVKSLRDVSLAPQDPYMLWEWHDLNGDGIPQLKEFTFYKQTEIQPYWNMAYPQDYKVDDQWNMTFRSRDTPQPLIVTIPLGGFDSKGNPLYSWKAARLVADVPQDAGYLADLSGGKLQGRPIIMGFTWEPTTRTLYYLLWDRAPNVFNPYDVKFRAWREGKQLFSIGTVTPLPQFWKNPGTEMILPAQMANPLGDFLFITDAWSLVHVFTKEGLYAGTLFKTANQPPAAIKNDPLYPQYHLGGELWWTHTFRNPQTGRSYLLAAGNAEPMARLYEITGLDQAKFFSGEVRK
jgi:hypothetical protein